MISSDEQPPPDHPSSSDNNQNHQKQQQQVSHTVSDIDLLKLTDDTNLDDNNNPLPKFSIR